MNKGAIFPLFYLPPVEFFAKLKSQEGLLLMEKEEHFPKQTYRNRASIYSANGKLDLVVPVIKGSKNQTKAKDVRISYDFNWQRLHWLSIQASYRNSAFFEFYEDDFAPFYHQRTEFLFDYNESLLKVILKALKLNVVFDYTKDYQSTYPEFIDYRYSIHPKLSSDYESNAYYQVFEDKNGFIPNLSILDLLCSKGPQSLQFL
ncbi:WbqC family protein [Desertivirga arenae]|uniref:WbqC family protein n=1 Tax=Desertivirga arenae TaxID=2810309 RepID=UPI001A95A634|nr:WbqC family protein [Pedobacter sp. SYSU D00823]